MTKRGENYQSRHDDQFKKYLKDNLSVDDKGNLSSKVYVQIYIGIKGGGRKSKNVFIPVSHLVWFLTKGEWPRDGYVIDHIDDNSLNNAPSNLRELTPEENYAKKRGKTTRNFGTSKYGHGISVYKDKRDNRYYAYRQPSRGETKLTKTVKLRIATADSLEEIESKIKWYIEHDYTFDYMEWFLASLGDED